MSVCIRSGQAAGTQAAASGRDRLYVTANWTEEVGNRSYMIAFSADLVCILSEFSAGGKSIVIPCGGDSQEAEKLAVEGREFGG
jgi:hypothetical protein